MPDSDSSRDFGSSKVYPREIWAILKKNEAAHPKSTVPLLKAGVDAEKPDAATWEVAQLCATTSALPACQR